MKKLLSEDEELFAMGNLIQLVAMKSHRNSITNLI